MNRFTQKVPVRNPWIRRCLYATALASLAVLPMRHADAATIAVTNCANSGAGSLRNAASIAASGDNIDMTGLTCGRILLQGTITLPQDDIVLLGPGRFALTVDGANLGRVFNHTGTGTARFYRLSITNGRFREVDAYGGCVNSMGSVELIRSRVHRCVTIPCCALEPSEAGGGVFARRRLLLSQSSVFYATSRTGFGGGVAGRDVTIYRSQVYNNIGSYGGGAYAFGTMSVTYSLIHNNEGHSGGGLRVEGATRLLINKSTISANRAQSGGGFYGGGSQETWVINSTLSGNSAPSAAAAWLLPYTFVLNSTIAFNQSTPTPGLDCGALFMSRDNLLVSSIVAQNTCTGGSAVDVRAEDHFGFGPISGGHNLIGVAVGDMPADTIFADPRLGPLTNNGGPTRTHLPASDSPALNRGQNLLNQSYDQRGPGFARVKGGIPDIGAIER